MDGRTALAFGALLRGCRVAAGLSQEELAERAGLSRRSIGDIERGVSRAPRKETVALLAHALDLSEKERAVFLGSAHRRRVALQPPIAARAGPVPTFHGRKHEIALLDRLLAGGRPPVLMLAGEPGIGKTRMLKIAASRAFELGFHVLEGSCGRGGRQEPFAPIGHALSAHLREQTPAQLRAALRECIWLQRLLPELSGLGLDLQTLPAVSPAQERRLTCEAAVRFLLNLASPHGQDNQRGVLLLLDDLHWAAPEAIDLLVMLAVAADQATGTGPLLILGAYRDTELRPEDPLALGLADLACGGLVTRLLFPPLVRDDAAELLRELIGEDIPQDCLEKILDLADGIPFFLVAWARALRDDLSAVAAVSRPSPPLAIPWDLAQVVRTRVAALPQSTQALVRAAAVLGHSVSSQEIAHLTERSPWDVVEGLAPACQARLLAPVGPRRYGFTHDLVRRVVASDLGVTGEPPLPPTSDGRGV
jgi:predicted ATPase/DNA-binding XRE family transcriptional regulator